MRSELPPVCRLMVAPGQVLLPSDRNYWPSSNHRALADAEDRLHLLVSKQSMGRFGEALADPLLKLDEVNRRTARESWHPNEFSE